MSDTLDLARLGRMRGEDQIAAELREIAKELPCCQRQMHLEIAAQIVEQGQFMSPNDFGFAIQVDDLRSRISELESALRPFAKAADVRLCGEWKDDEHFGRTDVQFYLTFGHLRQARNVLGEKA